MYIRIVFFYYRICLLARKCHKKTSNEDNLTPNKNVCYPDTISPQVAFKSTNPMLTSMSHKTVSPPIKAPLHLQYKQKPGQKQNVKSYDEERKYYEMHGVEQQGIYEEVNNV